MKSKLFLIILFLMISLSLISQTLVKKEDILSNKEWKSIYESYGVSISEINDLKSMIKDSLKIDVYFAFWCGDSKRNVPAFIKIIDELKCKKIKINYYSLERKKDKSGKYSIDDLKIERVPTFIFYKENKEIGRIIENPKKTLIDDFEEIIK